MKRTRCITMAALFAAMVYVTTTLIHLPVPMTGGYVHIGDAFIYLAAAMLPMPYAMAAGAVGAALADALGGYYLYVLPTLIIKALLVVPFSSRGANIISLRNVIASVIASLIGIAGYFLTDWFLYSNIVTAFSNMLVGMVQPFVSIVIFVMLGIALDRAGAKRRFTMM